VTRWQFHQYLASMGEDQEEGGAGAGPEFTLEPGGEKEEARLVVRFGAGAELSKQGRMSVAGSDRCVRCGSSFLMPRRHLGQRTDDHDPLYRVPK
jgi:hypothetical protein